MSIRWNGPGTAPNIGESYSVIGMVWQGISQKNYVTRVHYCDSKKSWFEWKRIGGEGISQCPVLVDAWAHFPTPEDVWAELAKERECDTK